MKHLSGARFSFYIKHLLVWCLLGSALYWAWLDRSVVAAFHARRWELPARIYATPLEIYQNFPLALPGLRQALTVMGYRQVSALTGPGQFVEGESSIDVRTRGFTFADGVEPAREVRIRVAENRIAALTDIQKSEALALVRFEPLEIGRIHSTQFEDRVLLSYRDLPPQFVSALTTVEDRRFFAHIGVDWLGILRAIWVNVLHGRIAQGGSTLTQQLVKNLYLGQQRTLRRKIREALMALSIERRFTKAEILETYVNEVFLGQDGNRAIHGFGLAAHFYFGRPLNELSTPELALLVGIIRGPTRYNPFKYPARAVARRNDILAAFAANGLLDAAQAEKFKRTSLGLRKGEWRVDERFSAFLDLVKRQLRRDYQEADLRTAGLKVFTSLDLLAQTAAEAAVQEGIAELAKKRREGARLQAAVIVADAKTSDIKAIVGGQGGASGGFNRALDAQRQIGSLVKPFVYLTAFENLDGFNVASELQDVPRTWLGDDKKPWAPQNYAREYNGPVSAQYALAKSLNLATVDLGFRVGVDSVRRTLRQFGVEGDVHAYPSLFLGALNLTPIEVTQLYQAMANDGFRIPLRAIQVVVDSHAQPIRRYGLKASRVASAESAYLTRYLLTKVVEYGTARRVSATFPNALPLAGKTGTTNDTRDSWFVGITGRDIATVWVGRDDNRSTGLTGATGALPIWLKTVSKIGPSALSMEPPPAVEWHWLSADGSALTGADCPGAIFAPVDIHRLPARVDNCVTHGASTIAPFQKGMK